MGVSSFSQIRHEALLDIMLESEWWSYPTPTATLIIILNDQETTVSQHFGVMTMIDINWLQHGS